MRKLIARISLGIFSLVLAVLAISTVAAPHWQQVAPGLEYRTIKMSQLSPFSKLHAFRISLRENQLDLALAKDHQQKTASVRQLAQISQALLAVNGGFFSPDAKPLGLRIQRGKQRNPVQPTSWWNVFYIEHNRAKIVSLKQYRRLRHHRISFAVQAGPRLLRNGKIPKLRENFAERTAIGIDNKGRVLLVVSQNAMLTTAELAKFMRKSIADGGLACTNAINLDGGSSTQLYSNLKDLHLNISSLSSVTDAIIVLPKKKG